MKEIKKYGSLFLLLMISFYYTNHWIESIRKTDPIMKEIISSKEKYESSPINAIITNEGIVPGLSGVEVNLEKSYSHMKQYGTYNEAMTVLKEVKPTISIENQFDYYISKGNELKKEIALIFKVDKTEDASILLETLKEEKVEATIFIDGNEIQKYGRKIVENKSLEYEVLSFENSYNRAAMKTSRAYLETLTHEKTKYCYTEVEREELKKNCAKDSLHTIKPLFRMEKDLYKEMKNNLKNASIYTIEINSENQKELKTTIQYIRQKGYQLVTLKNLLKETN